MSWTHATHCPMHGLCKEQREHAMLYLMGFSHITKKIKLKVRALTCNTVGRGGQGRVEFLECCAASAAESCDFNVERTGDSGAAEPKGGWLVVSEPSLEIKHHLTAESSKGLRRTRHNPCISELTVPCICQCNLFQCHVVAAKLFGGIS
jgi:hypothetical protein